MKKLLSIFAIGGLLFANNIKSDVFFAGINGGNLKIHDSDFVGGIRIGYYFYDPNSYKINNRIYIDAQKVNSDADFYLTSLKLDWIKNTSTPFAPFVGINVGYLYFEENDNDYSTNVWGGEVGILYQLDSQIDLEAEYTYQKAFEKKDIWNSAIHTFKIGIEKSF